MYAIGVMAFVMVTGHYPDNNSRMFRHFQSLNADGAIWKKIEKSCSLTVEVKDFIERLLLPQSLRLTVDEALSHEWMSFPQTSYKSCKIV